MQKYDCQDNEDEWVSSVIGTEDDAIYDVLDQPMNNKWEVLLKRDNGYNRQ